jgi:hypothetical protein
MNGVEIDEFLKLIMNVQRELNGIPPSSAN